MPGNVELPVSLLWGFLLVFARVAGVVALVPIPGLKGGPEAARVVLAVAMTLALLPAWPRTVAAPDGVATLLGWLLAEATLGLAAGLVVSYVAEAVSVGVQLAATQAGYGYAATFDPNTQAESPAPAVLAQLLAGLLFFSLRLDLAVFSALATGLSEHPPGSFLASRKLTEALVASGASALETGLRLALPIIAVLLTIDLGLALFGRLHQQLQVVNLAFPVKMLLFLVLLGGLTSLFPHLLSQQARHAVGLLGRLAR